MKIPGFNYLRFKDYLTLIQYNQAYDSMVNALNDSNQVIRENGFNAYKQHEEHPEVFANVWLNGFGEYGGAYEE